MTVPNRIFCTRIAIPGLSDGTDIDDIPIIRFEFNGFLLQWIELKILSIITHEHQAVGMSGKGDIETVGCKGFFNL